MTDEEIETLALEAIQRDDYDTAIRLLTPLAEKNSKVALLNLGWIYEHGPVGIVNKQTAREFYRKAISMGCADGYFYLGRYFWNEHMLTEAQEAFERGKELGSEKCSKEMDFVLCKMDELVAWEFFEKKDYNKVFELLYPHRDCDSDFTLNTLGTLYQTGLAGQKDPDLARTYFQRSAEIGTLDAYYRIGVLEKDLGNLEAARAAFTEGANKQHLPSMSQLGEMMIYGTGGPKDISKAENLLQHCSDGGHILSKVILSKLKIMSEKNIIKRYIMSTHIVPILFQMIFHILKDKNSPRLYGLISFRD